jgi:hypothetical protein
VRARVNRGFCAGLIQAKDHLVGVEVARRARGLQVVCASFASRVALGHTLASVWGFIGNNEHFMGVAAGQTLTTVIIDQAFFWGAVSMAFVENAPASA